MLIHTQCSPSAHTVSPLAPAGLISTSGGGAAEPARARSTSERLPRGCPSEAPSRAVVPRGVSDRVEIDEEIDEEIEIEEEIEIRGMHGAEGPERVAAAAG